MSSPLIRMVLIEGHWAFTWPRPRHLKHLISLVQVDHYAHLSFDILFLGNAWKRVLSGVFFDGFTLLLVFFLGIRVRTSSLSFSHNLLLNIYTHLNQIMKVMIGKKFTLSLISRLSSIKLATITNFTSLILAIIMYDGNLVVCNCFQSN